MELLCLNSVEQFNSWFGSTDGDEATLAAPLLPLLLLRLLFAVLLFEAADESCASSVNRGEAVSSKALSFKLLALVSFETDLVVVCLCMASIA